MRHYEAGEILPQQDEWLTRLVKQAIFQPISAVSNRYRPEKLAYINPTLRFTNNRFDFSAGLPARLPYMLAIGGKKKRPDALVYCRPGNRRTGLITSKSGILMDGASLGYLDEKGFGQMQEEFAEPNARRREHLRVYPTQAGEVNGNPVTWGGCNLNYALYDARACNGLASDGIRIVPTVAIVQIDRVPDSNGDFITTEEAIQTGLIAENSIPVVQFRAFVTPYRPKEFIFTEEYRLSKNELQRRRLMLVAALDDMTRDGAIPLDFSDSENRIPAYLDWFAITFGLTVARLHIAKKVHHWLHELHNVTLDVRVIDADGLEERASDRAIYQEMASLFHNYPGAPCELKKFYESIIKLFNLGIDSDTLLAKTVGSYRAELQP